MKITAQTLAATLAALLAAAPALAQSLSAGPGDMPGTTRPPSSEGPPFSLAPDEDEQVAETPPPPQQPKSPGTLTKLRGSYMSAPVVEGDQYPENGLGLPGPKGGVDK